MKKYTIALTTVFLFFVIGCGRHDAREAVIARIGNYDITKAEFEEGFKDSAFAASGAAEARKEYLDTLITKKLILLDAEKKGLVRDKSFLRMVERFWEQSLIKLALERKEKEITGSSFVGDDEIRKMYDDMVKKGDTAKSYTEMYPQIKWEAARRKESALMTEWIEDLKKKADIKINYEELKAR